MRGSPETDNQEIIRLLGEINAKLDRIPQGPPPMLTEVVGCQRCGRQSATGCPRADCHLKAGVVGTTGVLL